MIGGPAVFASSISSHRWAFAPELATWPALTPYVILVTITYNSGQNLEPAHLQILPSLKLIKELIFQLFGAQFALFGLGILSSMRIHIVGLIEYFWCREGESNPHGIASDGF
jgi:hypothetical protein